MRSIIKNLFLSIATMDIFAGLVGKWAAGKMTRFGEAATAPNPLRVIALDYMRHVVDLKPLSKLPDVEVLIFPIDVHDVINAFYKFRVEAAGKQVPDMMDPNLPEGDYLVKVLKAMMKECKGDAFLTCSIAYMRNIFFERACRDGGIAFIANHKESFTDAHVLDERSQVFRPFYGHRIFAASDAFRKNFERTELSGTVPLEIIGMPRFDDVYQEVEALPAKTELRKTVTLFTFLLCGNVVMFRDDPTIPAEDEGFHDLFDGTHEAIGRLAAENPDWHYIVKPKWYNDYFKDRIDAALMKGAGVDDLSKLKNLTITDKMSAHDAIKQSDVTVSFNSTTMVESVLYKVPVVVPVFGEATGKYSDRVQFGPYLKHFHIANSVDDLAAKTMAVAKGEAEPCPDFSPEFIREYIGNFDGKVSQRLADGIRKVVKEIA